MTTTEGERPVMPEGLKIVYQDAVNNIMFLKKQQFVIANYGVLACVSIIALGRLLKPESMPLVCHEKWVLGILSVAAVAVSGSLIWCTQKGLAKFRRRVTAFVSSPYFTDEERKSFELPYKGKSPFTDWPFLLAYALALAGAVTATVTVTVAR